MQPHSRMRLAHALHTAMVLALCGGTTAARADVLSNNLSSVSGGTEATSGTTWNAASFSTGSSAYSLNSVTLLLDNSAPGTAQLDIYSDFAGGGVQPGTYVGTLLSPTTYSSSLANTTFTSTGISLSANSTYWAVLHATVGTFDWSFASDDNGMGTGFTDNWAQSGDSGATYNAFTGFPLQMNVTAAASAVPEPGTVALMLAGTLPAVALLRRRAAKRHAASAVEA